MKNEEVHIEEVELVVCPVDGSTMLPGPCPVCGTNVQAGG